MAKSPGKMKRKDERNLKKQIQRLNIVVVDGCIGQIGEVSFRRNALKILLLEGKYGGLILPETANWRHLYSLIKCICKYSYMHIFAFVYKKRG